jgi:hypothetical protein
MTWHPGIFVGGDMVPAERTVTVAVGHGKKAARAIDAWLRGTVRDAPQRHDLAGYDRLNTWYYSDAPATVRPKLEATRRTGTFDEVSRGLDASTAAAASAPPNAPARRSAWCRRKPEPGTCQARNAITWHSGLGLD